MRTTLTIDNSIAAALKKAAHESGRSFKEVVNETLRAGLAQQEKPQQGKPYHLQPVSMGTVTSEYDLDKALTLAETLENEELIRKLHLRK